MKYYYGDVLRDIADTLKRIATVMEAKEAVLERYGKIDVLVNNAAINDMFENPTAALELSKFENYPISLWKKSIDVNVTGVFLCSQIFGSVMAEAQSGSIINIASTYAVTAPDQFKPFRCCGGDVGLRPNRSSNGSTVNGQLQAP
jgi:NAD(P)-dependent dehydrogenase (short-subunit alcohol dehydrogenase family)